MDIIGAVTGVFTAMGEWISQFIPTLIALFWTPGTGETAGSLTFLGVLALCSLAVSIFFLIMGLIQNFLHFRG